MSCLIAKALIGIMLFICSLTDIKYKKIPIGIMIIEIILIIILLPFRKDIGLVESLMGGFSGGIIILISKVSRGRIGMGDGLLLSVTGIGLGYKLNLIMFTYAMFLSAVFSILLLIIKRVGRNYTLPFVPFLLTGYIGIILW